MNKLRNFLIPILIITLLSGCKEENIIKDFNLDFSNISSIENNTLSDTLAMNMDLSDAISQGIIIPTKNQSNDGLFHFKASIKKTDKKLFYKIYYQNESYKFEEDNPLSGENFYGSWEDTDIEFKPLPKNGIIEDAFRIVGNPRNEHIYFGADPKFKNMEEEIAKGIEMIRRDENWFNNIKTKAKENKLSVDDQLYRDICWILKINDQNGETNNRFKRNPRTGVYSFLLVIADQEGLKEIPNQIKNISLSDSIKGFINPYHFFLNGKGKSIKGIHTKFSKQSLSLRAVISPENGVYVDILSYPNQDFKIYPNNKKVGNTDTLYYKALYQQYFHNVPRTHFLNNIPLVEDILDDTYTTKEYNENLSKFKNSKDLIKDHPYITDYPAKTVRVDNQGRYISLINPGNKDRLDKPKKESVGVSTRIGFTYGKFRGKIKFPAQLNKSGLWSGLTNAFWLIYQSEQEWNARRICDKGGYVKYAQDDGTQAERTNSSNYSEIDIEIIKTSKYWHKEDAPKGYNPFNKDECVLACTNWDLSCPSPKNFYNGGTHKYKYLSKNYTYVRWYDAYRALTSREAIPNNIFHKDYYYYEIEWKPNEIIWRIGESPDKMYEVGYMNEKFTVIPNNQMISVITQEYHYSEFWPPIIYDQNFLPYPKKDIEGKIYEIVVE
ncbi:MAG: hypothetical protein M0O93_07020 [Bacteroidales bacterium]|nr:hypothetical protein [Bacteroidales bacterium]